MPMDNPVSASEKSPSARRPKNGKRLDLPGLHVFAAVAGLLAVGGAMTDSIARDNTPEAIAATVRGETIQKVGFRAMIQKEAIMLNLAGTARNNPDGTVAVTLQGDKHRIDELVDAMRAGNKKSSTKNAVSATAIAVDPSLKTFTVYGWTSTTRNITNPYDLVFELRPDDKKISRGDAKAAWNAIAQKTLKGDDLAKFMKHLDEDD